MRTRLFRAQIAAPDNSVSTVVRWIVASSLSDAMAEIEFTLRHSASIEKIEDGSKLFRDCVEIEEKELNSHVICSPHIQARRFQGRTLHEAISILGD